MNIKKILLPGLGLGAWVVAALIPLIATSVANGAHDLWIVAPHADKGAERMAKDDFKSAKPSDPDYAKKVLNLYGSPYEDKQRLVVSASKIVRPAEKPDLAFIFVDKTKGEDPLQAKMVLFFATYLKGGAVITGALFLVLWMLSLWAAPAKGARLASAE